MTKMIDRRKRSKALSEVKLAENISKNLQSFLEIFKRWSIFHKNCKPCIKKILWSLFMDGVQLLQG